MTRTPVFTIWILLAGIVAAPSVRSATASSSSRPNIILILADDLGYGELGSYGQQKIKTPNLDRMAREGLRFTQFYAGATVCAPSRSVLMTGQHGGHTTVRGNASAKDRSPQTLRSNDVTVAEMLKSAGYNTGLIGKWGLGMNDEGHPNRQGFDYFFGYLSQLHAHNHFPDHLWRNFDKVPLRNKIVPMGEDGAGYSTNALQFAGDLFAEEVLDFIDRSTNQPFFLYFCPVVPHSNNERRKALGNGMEVPDFGPYKNEPWDDALKGHAAMITRLDSDIGRIRQHLKVTGLERKTLIIFTSDNGPHKEGAQDSNFFEPSGPLNGFKRDLTDGGIRVPFIATWPGKIQSGVPWHIGYFGDLMATFAELAQAPAPEKIDSISLVPTFMSRSMVPVGPAMRIKNPPQPAHQHLYWEFHESGFSQAVLLGNRWKGIRLKRLDSAIQLYDLYTDPAEKTDVAGKYPVIVKRIEFLFRTERTDSPLWPIKEAPVEKAKDSKQ